MAVAMTGPTNNPMSAGSEQPRSDSSIPLLGQGLDAGRLPGSAAAHPPLLDVVQIYDRMPPDHKRDTIRALTRGQQLVWVTLWLARRDDATWHTIIETVSTEARTYAVRSLMTARRMNEPRGPWGGAYGVLNGLSDTDQLAVLNQLGGTGTPNPSAGLGYSADRQDTSGKTACPGRSGCGSVDPSGELSVGLGGGRATPENAHSCRSLGLHGKPRGTCRRTHECIERYEDDSYSLLVRDDSVAARDRAAADSQRVATRPGPVVGNSPRGDPPSRNAPTFRWVSKNIGAMDRPFTVAELQSIPPALVKKFNADRNSLTPAEATLLSRTVSLHVDSIDVVRGGSPWVSWSVPPRKGQPEPVTCRGGIANSVCGLPSTRTMYWTTPERALPTR